MKAKITKKDGTVIELEGTAAELNPIVERELATKFEIKPTPPPFCPGIGAKTGWGKRLEELLTRPQQWAEPTWALYNDMCPMGGAHEYPAVWNSITPAPCSKCAKPGWNPTTYTVGFSAPDPATIPFVSGLSAMPTSEPQS